MTTLVNDFPNGPSYLAQHLEAQLLVKAAKKGEGSRGGHIIGHTKSGKPVYAPGPGGRYSHMASGGYFKSPEEVSKKDAEIVMGHYPGFTADDHQEAGEILEDPNFHTPASAHFLAAQKLAYHNNDEGSQASVNDLYGASALDRHGIVGAGGEMGRTYHGHQIPVAGHSLYQRIHESAGPDVAGKIAVSTFPHFKAKDHQVAARAHRLRGARRLQRGREILSEYPKSSIGSEMIDEGTKNLNAGYAHDTAAALLNPRRKSQ